MSRHAFWRAVLAALFLFLAATDLLAQSTFTWSYYAPNGDLSQANNWDEGLPPNNGTADLDFSESTRSSLTLTASLSVNSLTFSSNVPSNDLGSASANTFTLGIGAGGMTLFKGDTSNLAFVNFAAGLPIQLQASQTWQLNDGSVLNVAGVISDVGGNQLTFDVNHNYTYNTAEVHLSGNNTYAGGTVINDDFNFYLGSNSAFGTGKISIWGGTVSFTSENGSHTLANAIDFNADDGEFIHNGNQGSLTLSGTLTMYAALYFHLNGRYPLYLSGNLGESGGSQALNVYGSTNHGGINGTVYVQGTNTYTGGTFVNSSNLIFASTASIPATGSLRSSNSAYIGVGSTTFPSSLQVDFINRFDMANTNSAIGFDTDPAQGSPNNFTGPIDLTGFNANARLGSATRAIISGTITPQGLVYNFGLGGGYLEVASNLVDGVLDSPRSVYLESNYGSGSNPLTVRLTGTNTYTQGTTVSGSALIFGTPSSLPTTGNLNLNGKAYIGLGLAADIPGTDNTTVPSFLNRFDNGNAGIVGFDSADVYTPRTIAAAVDLNSSDSFGNGTYLGTSTNLTLSGQLTFPGDYQFVAYRGGQLTIQSALTGNKNVTIGVSPDDYFSTGPLTSDPSSTLFSTVTLTGNNSYSGYTVLYAGRLVVGQGTGVVGTDPSTALGTGVLYAEGNTLDNGRPSIRLEAASPGIIIPNDIYLYSGLELTGSNSFRLDGTIGADSNYLLSKYGTGTVTITGTNFFNGGVYIDQGNVTFTHDQSAGLGALSFGTGSNSATFTSLAPSIGGLSGGGASSLLTLASGSTLTIYQDSDATFAGVIAGSTAIVSKFGGAALDLSGDSTFSGGLDVHEGVLLLGSSTKLNGTVSADPLHFNTGPVGTGALTIEGGAELSVSVANVTLANAVHLNGLIDNDDANDANLAGNLILTGLIDGTGGFDWCSYGTLTLTNAANTFVQGVFMRNGTLHLGASSTGNPGSVTAGPMGVGFLTLYDGTTVAASAPAVTLANYITLNDAGGNYYFGETGNANNLTLTGHIQGLGNIGYYGAGKLTLSGISDFSSLSVYSGTLVLANSSFVGDGITGPVGVGTLNLFDGSTLGVDLSILSLPSITLRNNIALDPTSATHVTIDSSGGPLLISSHISGAAGITVTGAHNLTLTSDNTFTGGVTVTGSGILALGSNTKNSGVTTSTLLFTTGPVGTGTLTLQSGATLTTAGIDNITFANNVVLPGGGVTFAFSNEHYYSESYYYDSVVLGGTISGSGTINLYGTPGNLHDGYHAGGYLLLSGANSGWSGGLNIFGNNTVYVNSDNALGTGPLWIDPSSNSTVEFSSSSPTLGGLSGGFSGSYNSTIQIDAETILTINQTTNGTFAGIISGTSLIKAGTGTLTLTGANTNSATAITAGTLQIGNGGTTGSVASNIVDNATLAFNRSDNSFIYGGVISGTGALNQIGTGSLYLTGANTYSGGTTVTAGKLYLGNTTGSATGTGNISVAAGAELWVGDGTAIGSLSVNVADAGKVAFNRPDTQTYAGVISGSGVLDKQGTNTLTLTGANTYTGNTLVSNGTLTVGALNALPVTTTVLINPLMILNVAFDQTIAGLGGNGNIQLATGKTLTLNNASSASLGGAISGAGTLVKTGVGTLTLSGASTYTGGTVVDFGTLNVAGGSVSQAAANVTVGNLSGDNAFLTVSSAGSVTSNYSSIGNIAGSTGSVTVTGAGSSWNNGFTDVGLSGTGSLTIASGGSFAGSVISIGRNPGGTGSVTATGSGSSLALSGVLLLGNEGTGSLAIASGASVSDFGSSVGFVAGSSGTATVAGTGSTWTNSLNLFVGNFAPGSLAITGGGLVSATHGQLGSNAGVTGTAMVDGAGSTWSNSSDLFVGVNGNGTLTLANGGTVKVNSGTGLVTLGNNSGAQGTLNIGASSAGSAAAGGMVNAAGITTGSGTGTLQFKTTATAGTPYYLTKDGTAGGTAVTITGPTQLINTAGYNVLTGANTYTGGTTIRGGTLAVNAGSISQAAANIEVGFNGSDNGTLTIGNGGTVSSYYGFIGDGLGSTGAVAISGAGSSWTLNPLGLLGIGIAGHGSVALTNGGSVSTGLLYVGGGDYTSASTGSLSIASGSTVSSADGLIANAVGSTGTVTVDGAGSLWTVLNDIEVGLQGAGAFSLTNGAHVTAGAMNIGDNGTGIGTVSVSNSTLAITNDVQLGSGGASPGTLHITNGGHVTSTNLSLGASTGSTGTVTIDGTGSSWTDSNNLFVGNLGTGSLAITNGGTMTSAYAFLGFTTGSTGTVTVDGAGSLWSNQGFIVGGVGSGALVISNGGTVNASGGAQFAVLGNINGELDIGAKSTSPAAAGGYLVATAIATNGGLGTLQFNTTATPASPYYLTQNGTAGGTAVGITGVTKVVNTNGYNVLTGTNDYTGGTTINGGTLVAGSNSAFGSGTVTLSGGQLGVANGVTFSNPLNLSGGGTLSGNGTFAGPLTLGAGVIVSPGNSPGNMTFTNTLTINPGFEYDWQVQNTTGTAGTNWDLITVSGTPGVLDLTNAGNFTLKVISLNLAGNPGALSGVSFSTSYSWVIASAAGGITGFNASNFIIDGSSSFITTNGFGGTFGVAVSGNNLVLNFTSVPEPSTYALLALGLGFLGLTLRRRRA